MRKARRIGFGIGLAATLACAAPAAADPVLLRMAVAAPDGTAWAREIRAFARDVEGLTGGAVRMKWYFGGIAGDELTVADRIRREQLDGAISGGMLCQRLAPSMRVMRVLGLVTDRDEAAYVISRLKPTIDREMQERGFTNVVEGGLGPDTLFSRDRIASMDDLRRSRPWVWDLEDTLQMQLAELGVRPVALPLDAAARAYDDGRLDGFLAAPTAALAWQWSAQSRYVSDLPVAFLVACLVIANRSFDPLPIEAQQGIRAAAAKLQARFEDLGRTQDRALLHGLFARQGLVPIAVSDEFRAGFLSAARAARDRLGDKLVPPPLVDRVTQMLEDYRKEHQR